jgi:hypothetical protein
VLMAVVWGLVLWKEHSAVSKTSSLSVFVGCIVFAGAIAAGTFLGR